MQRGRTREEAMFPSAHVGNRICPRCRASNSWANIGLREDEYPSGHTHGDSLVKSVAESAAPMNKDKFRLGWFRKRGRQYEESGGHDEG